MCASDPASGLKDELERTLASFKNPLLLYLDGSGIARVLEHDELRNTQVSQEAIRRRVEITGDEIDLETWPEWPDAAEKALPMELAKALYLDHRINQG